MTTLGLDFYNKRNSPTVFKQAIEAAQNSAMQAKWILCDAYFFAEDSPQYDDIFHQYFNERKGSLNSIKKYRSTIRKFPYARRKHELSIEAYYTVVSLDEPDQDRLLSQFASGELETRQALRDAVNEVKERPKTETTRLDLPVIELNGRRYVVADDVPHDVDIVQVKFDRVLEVVA